ncbi:MAG: phospholipase D-like domain-containing protein [Peptococcaceae bacterium]|nr:phospholipase D-like domain-containing protein [Peptococcaceae bacterium]
MRKVLFPLLVLSMVLILAGCSLSRQAISPPANQVNPENGTKLSISGSIVSGTLIVEPQAGLAPYLSLVQSAHHSIDLNSYLLTDHSLVSALVQKAQSGVNVRVIVAGNPYRDQKVVDEERAGFAGTKVQFRLAPAQFGAPYTFDHAKYLVVDSTRAILGSSNMDYSGLGGGNREYDYETSDPGIVANLTALFNADWSGQSVQLVHPGPLVVSPGSEATLVNLIQGAKQRLYIESEELGNDRIVLDAVVAAIQRGVQVEVVLPGKLSRGDRRNAEGLVNAGAHVRYLTRPYPHAKLIVADDRAFLGSQNISVSSLDRDREVGIVVEGSPVERAAQVFQQDFARAK